MKLKDLQVTAQAYVEGDTTRDGLLRAIDEYLEMLDEHKLHDLALFILTQDEGKGH